MTKPKIKILDKDFAIHRLQPNDNLPGEVLHGNYSWIGKTDEELSVVCDAGINLKSQKSDNNWAAIKLVGPLDFSDTGILSEITHVLADASIGIFAFSTYDTDYILIKKTNVEKAAEALRKNGYVVEPEL